MSTKHSVESTALALPLAALANIIVANTADIEKAVDDLLKIVASRPDLEPELIKLGVRASIHHARGIQREQLRGEPKPVWTLPAHAADKIAERGIARASLYDWLMPNSNKRLGDATVEDLEAAAEYHAEQAAGQTARAVMYRRIAQAIGNKAGVVRSHLTAAALARIMEAK